MGGRESSRPRFDFEATFDLLAGHFFLAGEITVQDLFVRSTEHPSFELLCPVDGHWMGHRFAHGGEEDELSELVEAVRVLVGAGLIHKLLLVEFVGKAGWSSGELDLGSSGNLRVLGDQQSGSVRREFRLP